MVMHGVPVDALPDFAKSHVSAACAPSSARPAEVRLEYISAVCNGLAQFGPVLNCSKLSSDPAKGPGGGGAAARARRGGVSELAEPAAAAAQRGRGAARACSRRREVWGVRGSAGAAAAGSAARELVRLVLHRLSGPARGG
jgi:hypothetical protein